MKKELVVPSRIEILLRIWEQSLRLGFERIRSQDIKATGAFKHWRELREELNQIARPVNLSKFELSNYSLGYCFDEKGPRENENYCLYFYSRLPLFFSEWTQTSRRIFCLSSNLQKMLEYTSLERVTWNDIDPPFSNFVIRLETSIFTYTAERVDQIWCRLNKDQRQLEILLISDINDGFQFISEKDWDRISKLSRERNKEGLHSKIQELSPGVSGKVPILLYFHRSCGDRADLEIIPKEEPAPGEERNNPNEPYFRQASDLGCRILNIVLGLCIYMNGSYKDNFVPVKDEAPHKDDIISGSTTIMVDSGNLFSDEERTLCESEMDKVGTGMTPHLRRAHWRRPIGQGSDPLAKRTVRIPSLIVNRHLVSKGELPKVTTTRVT